MIPVRYVRAAAVVVTVCLVLYGPVYVAFGARHEGPQGWTALVLGGVVLAVQLRHSLAAMRGERPRYGYWTFALLVPLTTVPLLWFSWTWANTLLTVAASALMVFRSRLAWLLFPVPLLVNGSYIVGYHLTHGPPLAVLNVVITVAAMVAFPLAVLGGARLVHLLHELDATRAELAAVSVARERLRISRDLHDMLGQSLSAYSLKGDLALRLLPSRPEAARAELAGMAEVAVSALTGLRAIGDGGHRPDLDTELAAASLLAAAGVALRTEVVPPTRHREVLAWTLREAVTNLVRHSDATTATISLRPGRLEIGNDGAGPAGPDGNGLAGLRQRAEAEGGRLRTESRAGHYRLVLDLPGEGP
ncbi:two-component system sensor histidine kinase DesK [Crossiella equi]|uniref:Two-component system sensor histidine kinase DesK n=1 Tax=Crossiella equi TaxID=130796 RepID=A0ABS5AA18_9PSEU|nr:histidine kinase [Crossiella equi]MBP2472585.1 two-component system sensor histidine kinase DesK [Crossiella equi]